jgi:hypothetical protein
MLPAGHFEQGIDLFHEGVRAFFAGDDGAGVVLEELRARQRVLQRFRAYGAGIGRTFALGMR